MATRSILSRAGPLGTSLGARPATIARHAALNRALFRRCYQADASTDNTSPEDKSAKDKSPKHRSPRRPRPSYSFDTVAKSRQIAHQTHAQNNVPGGVPSTWENFPRRHIGPRDDDIPAMLKELGSGAETMEDFLNQVIPEDVRLPPFEELTDSPFSESRFADMFERLAKENGQINDGKRVPLIPMQGGGYYPIETPPVIRRNILESPAWYTSYTPYQAEISQGRLESLLNFQTMVSDLTGLPIANASLLDEGTAAAEAMTLSINTLPASRAKKPGKVYVVSDRVHRRTIEVLHGRAEGFGVEIKVVDLSSSDALGEIDQLGEKLVGVLVQYPDTKGGVQDHKSLADKVHEHGALLTAATDLSALTLLTPPGEWGADIAVGNSQRFGVPLGYGGPHAAFMSVKESSKRRLPGRLVGVSKDRLGRPALRLALQTREQHIRREKATSNVCTAQALLANMAAMYAVWHGPTQLRNMAIKDVLYARAVAALFTHYGYEVVSTDANGKQLSDTVTVRVPGESPAAKALIRRFESAGICGTRVGDDLTLACTAELDAKVYYRIAKELSRAASTQEMIAGSQGESFAREPRDAMEVRLDAANKDAYLVSEKIWQDTFSTSAEALLDTIPETLRRTSTYLTHPVFNSYHSETEMLRYIHHLQSKDLSLTHAMIPLGSCTMKLNATSQMELISNPNHANVHPLANNQHASGHRRGMADLSMQLEAITGMDGVTLQPNSGAQGEFAGLRAIRKYLDGTSKSHRDICLIPSSAHGTNPASAAMAGMRVVIVKCDSETGNLDLADLKDKCEKHKDELAAIMITYPSTFGVFEPDIIKICKEVHDYGGQVYMDGANMNAQIGLTSPGALGADVCHLNLHKTFCIPHGGGGPGVGPICVKEHLKPYLPGAKGQVPVASAHAGSASILPISWAYITTMGKLHSFSPALSNSLTCISRLGRSAPRHQHGSAQRQLHPCPPEAPLPHRVHQRQRPLRSRVHPRHPAFQGILWHRGCRHRQASSGLRLPPSHAQLPHRQHAHDRAHGE